MTDEVAVPAEAAEVVNVADQQPVDGGEQSHELQQTTGEQQQEQAEQQTETPEQKQKGIEKRFSEMTRAKKDAERRAAEADKRLERVLDALERGGGKQQPAAQPEAEPELVEPEFESPEQYKRDMAAYTRALAEQTARKVVQAQRAEEEHARAVREQQQQQFKAQQDYAKRVQEARDELPDYDDVAGSDDITISVPMAHAITRSKYGPKIAYFLGQNPAEAERISALDPTSQILEIGELAAKLSAPKTPEKSKAPPPIAPIKGGSAPARKEPHEMSMEEYAAMRRGAK